jgi:hypothetical protein
VVVSVACEWHTAWEMVARRSMSTYARVVPCLLLTALACAGGASGAATPLVTVHPAQLRLSFGLPTGWQVTGLHPGTRFEAVARNNSAHLVVSVGSYPGTFQGFKASEMAGASAFYRAQDPSASLTTKTITLPSGTALQITVLLRRGAPLAIYLFALLHNGVSYHFTYYTAQSLAKADLPDFLRSAQSIQFTK